MSHRRFIALVIFFTLLMNSLSACSPPQPSAAGSRTAPAPAKTAAQTSSPPPVLAPPSNAVYSPEQQGLDSSRLAEMLAYIQEKNIRMHSILVVRNGHLVLDAYFNPYDAQTPHQMASITKSVLGALVGIAIQQGKIEGQDWVQFVLDLPMVAEPGTEWAYCSSAVHLVSAILQQATGIDARSFANQNIFAPIGVRPVPPERGPTDPAGISTGGHGLQLTPLEVARFAYLYLNGGRWGDRQVVPEDWVAESLTPQVHAA